LEGEWENILDDSISEIRPHRIAIDSLSHFEMFVPERELRREVYRLLMYFKTKGLSSIGTWDAPQTAGQTFSVTEAGMSFLVDCIVLLRFVEIQSSLKKGLAILKMRGSDHDKRLREFEITSRGIKVTEAFTDYEGLMTGSPRRSLTDDAARAMAEALGTRRGRSA